MEIRAKRAAPAAGDYIGHLWILWPETPAGARAGTREAGYYANGQVDAALGLAGALAAPWGILTGHAPTAGRLRADDGLRPDFVWRIRVTEAAYTQAQAVDARWRTETRYVLRPGIAGAGPARTFACQDYVREVAGALGLQIPPPDWSVFPPTQFRRLLVVNGLPAS